MTPQLAPHRVNIQTCIQNVSLSLTTRHLPADASSVGRTSSSVCLRREQQRETSNDLAHLAYIPQAHSRDMCMQPPAPSARSTQHTRRFQKAHDHALTAACRPFGRVRRAGRKNVLPCLFNSVRLQFSEVASVRLQFHAAAADPMDQRDKTPQSQCTNAASAHLPSPGADL